MEITYISLQRGSNQYKKEKKGFHGMDIFWIYFLTLFFVISGSFISKHVNRIIYISPLATTIPSINIPKIKAPLSAVLQVSSEATESAQMLVNPDYDAIHSEITQVFGKYAPRAFQLLQDPSCHENGYLRPEAVNVNWSQTPGVADSRDWGVFQINDKWQKITNVAFLTDYHINIRIAWNIFINHNYSFDAWTCGKFLHI